MSDYGMLTGPGRLEFRRRFSADIERVWEYLIDPKLRMTWFCGGHTDRHTGGRIEFDFDHSRISDRPPPEKHDEDSKATFEGEILEYEPRRRLAFTWPEVSGVNGTRVVIELTETGDGEVELHLVHEGLSIPDYRNGAIAGWHTHFDLLDDLLSGRERRDFWKRHEELEQNYADRI